MLGSIILYGYICPLIICNLMCHIGVYYDTDISPREKIKDHIIAFFLCLIPVIYPIIVILIGIDELMCKFDLWVEADPARHIPNNTTKSVKKLKVVKKKSKAVPIENRFEIIDL